MVRCSASTFGLLVFIALALQACGPAFTVDPRVTGVRGAPSKETTGGRAQKLVALKPKKVAPYFGNVTTFVVQANVVADDAVLKSGNLISAEEATQRLAEELRRRGVRVSEGEAKPKGSAAFVNVSLELGTGPDARRFGYRLSVTKKATDLDQAFDRDTPACLRDRRTGSISVAGHGGKDADLDLIDGIANDVVQLVPKDRREQPTQRAAEEESSIGNLAAVEAFVVRTRFDFDPTLQSKKGYWTAGSAKAYLTKLLTEHGLRVVDSPKDVAGRVAYVNHWIKGGPKTRTGRDGFDYKYEAFYAVTQSDREYRPLLESQDKGTGDFDFFEDGERAELERYADELTKAYRASR